MNKEDTSRVISLKAKLRSQYQILNSDTSTVQVKKAAAKNAIEIQEEIVKLDNTFVAQDITSKYPDLFDKPAVPKDTQKEETAMPKIDEFDEKETLFVVKRIRHIFQLKQLGVHVDFSEISPFIHGVFRFYIVHVGVPDCKSVGRVD